MKNKTEKSTLKIFKSHSDLEAFLSCGQGDIKSLNILVTLYWYVSGWIAVLVISIQNSVRPNPLFWDTFGHYPNQYRNYILKGESSCL